MEDKSPDFIDTLLPWASFAKEKMPQYSLIEKALQI